MNFSAAAVWIWIAGPAWSKGSSVIALHQSCGRVIISQ